MVPDVEVATKGDEITVSKWKICKGIYGQHQNWCGNSSFKHAIWFVQVDNRQIAAGRHNETKFIFLYWNVGKRQDFHAYTEEPPLTARLQSKTTRGSQTNSEKPTHQAFFVESTGSKRSHRPVILLQLAPSNAEKCVRCRRKGRVEGRLDSPKNTRRPRRHLYALQIRL